MGKRRAKPPTRRDFLRADLEKCAELGLRPDQMYELIVHCGYWFKSECWGKADILNLITESLPEDAVTPYGWYE